MILLFKWNDKKFSFLLSMMNVDVSAKKKKNENRIRIKTMVASRS